MFYTFRAGPFLTSPDAVRIPRPKATQGTWTWFENVLDNVVPLSQADQNVRITITPPVATIPVGKEPTDIAITFDGSIAMTANALGVSMIDIASRSVITTIPLEGGPSGIAMLPTPLGTGALAMVAISDSQVIRLIDITNRVALPGAIDTGQNVGNAAMAVTPDGSHALIANTSSNLFTKI